MLKLTRHQRPDDDYWTLDAKAGDVQVKGRPMPFAFSLGTIDRRGINVWTPACGAPRGYKRVAKALLEAARADLKTAQRLGLSVEEYRAQVRLADESTRRSESPPCPFVVGT